MLVNKAKEEYFSVFDKGFDQNVTTLKTETSLSF